MPRNSPWRTPDYAADPRDLRTRRPPLNNAGPKLTWRPPSGAKIWHARIAPDHATTVNRPSRPPLRNPGEKCGLARALDSILSIPGPINQ